MRYGTLLPLTPEPDKVSQEYQYTTPVACLPMGCRLESSAMRQMIGRCRIHAARYLSPIFPSQWATVVQQACFSAQEIIWVLQPNSRYLTYHSAKLKQPSTLPSTVSRTFSPILTVMAPCLLPCFHTTVSCRRPLQYYSLLGLGLDRKTQTLTSIVDSPQYARKDFDR